MKLLTFKQIEELREFDTPTISNAIETFNIRSRAEGFTRPSLVMRVSNGEKPMVGYAVTAKVSAKYPMSEEHLSNLKEYYALYSKIDQPKIAVIQDIDHEPIGSFWGDVQATIHKALGAVGVITSGGVRDIDEVEKVGFYMFSKEILVSHAYNHLESYDCTVDICGLTINPGDLIHADIHGAIVIPHEIAPYLAEACRKYRESERILLDPCEDAIKNGRTVTSEEIISWRNDMLEQRENLGKS